jgi:hypothetical protein
LQLEIEDVDRAPTTELEGSPVNVLRVQLFFRDPERSKAELLNGRKYVFSKTSKGEE